MAASTKEKGRVGENRLGSYLKKEREGMGFTLREVEEATDKEISNAYLSQLENGKIARPSPTILHTLAKVYNIAYEQLMRRAGYIPATSESNLRGKKHGRAATFAVDNLTEEEERELLEYLSFVRSKRKHS